MAMDISLGGSTSGGASLRAGTITVDGLKELNAALESLPMKLQKQALRKAMRDAAKPILARAKQNAPVGTHDGLQSLGNRTAKLGKALGATEKQIAKAVKRTLKQATKEMKKSGQRYPGQLRDSIKIRAMKRNRNGRVGVMVQTAKGDFKGDTFYGAFVEYGTSKMTGRGYMRKAFDVEAENAINIVAGVLRSEIERLGRAGA